MTHPAATLYSRETFVATTRDPDTGRRVHQLTDHPQGRVMSYFRVPKHIPDGWMIARINLAIHPESGRVRELPLDRFYLLHLDKTTGQGWLCDPAQREIWSVDFPFGLPRKIATLPTDWPSNRHPAGITCDGNWVIASEYVSENIDITRERDPVTLWRYFNRKRSGSLWAWNLHDHRLIRLAHFDTLGLGHILPSPTRPEWIAFSTDNYEAVGQRIWAVKIDGSDLHPVRPQERGEWISHEFWMPDGQTLGYKYQDRRQDPELMELPWAEYAHVPTHVGLADVSGPEIYQSAPLNHYHSHVMVSPDGSHLLGEGTDGHFFIYAAHLDRTSPRLDFIPHARLHTPYVPTSGMHVNGGFSHDNRWLLYSDQVDQKFQIFAVEVAL
jgi:hypothetical protein